MKTLLLNRTIVYVGTSREWLDFQGLNEYEDDGDTLGFWTDKKKNQLLDFEGVKKHMIKRRKFAEKEGDTNDFIDKCDLYDYGITHCMLEDIEKAMGGK